MNKEHYKKLRIQRYLQKHDIDISTFWEIFNKQRQRNTFNIALVKTMLIIFGKSCMDDIKILIQ